MLVPDPARAAREIARVLRPGGRVALAVWGPRERNPWLGVVFDAVSAQLGAPVPPPGVPGPFSLDDAGRLAVRARRRRASTDVAVEELADAAARRLVRRVVDAHVGARRPARAASLASCPRRRRAALAARAARGGRAPTRRPTGLELPGLTLVASAGRQRTV